MANGARTMSNEPRLIGAILGSLVGGLFIYFGRHVIPEERDSIRVLFILIGGIALFWAASGFIDWVVYRFNYHLGILRKSWFAPTLSLAYEINRMDRDKLRLFERVGPFESIGHLGNTGMRWMLYSPLGEIPFTWIVDYLEKCESRYPTFIPQHGMPDSLQRDYVRWFTGVMVNSGMAEKSIGTRPARWNVPMELVYEKLGLKETD